jgi:hypothetical protein
VKGSRSAAIAAIAAVLATGATAAAGDIVVSGSQGDFQAALAAARPGDRVIVEKGVHRGHFLLRADGVEVVAGPRARFVARDRSGGAAPVLRVVGDGNRLRGLVVVGGRLQLEGARCAAEDCVIRGAPAGDRAALEVEGRDAELLGNRVERSSRAGTALRVRGSRARVAGNLVAVGPRTSAGIVAEGIDVHVEGNAVEGRRGGVGISTGGHSPRIDGNRLAGVTLRARGDNGILAGNEVTASPLGRAAVDVAGNGNLLRTNRIADGEDTGLLVEGDGNVVEGGEVRNQGTSIAGVDYGHGVILRGAGNGASGVTVESCLGDGFRVVGRILWTWDGAAGMWSQVPVTGAIPMRIEACMATGVGACGLGNWSGGTLVTGSTFLGNGVDVADGSGFSIFEGNDWSTGGPGWTGTNPATPDLWRDEPVRTSPRVGGGGNGVGGE